jgi:hypothetical protein
MRRPTRASKAGSAYLDLQNRARRERRGTQARLSTSDHASNFVLKGGVLLAAYDARRPTADLDTLARSIAAVELGRNIESPATNAIFKVFS